MNTSGIAGYVALTGGVLNIQDAHQDVRFDPSYDKKYGYVTRSVLCMPILARTAVANAKGSGASARVVGVVQMINKLPKRSRSGGGGGGRKSLQEIHAFTSDDEQKLKSFIALLAGPIEHNFQLEAAHRDTEQVKGTLQAAERRLAIMRDEAAGLSTEAKLKEQLYHQKEGILRLTRELSVTVDVASLFAKVVVATRRLLGADRGTLFLVDHETRELWSRVSEGMAREIRIPLTAGVVGHAVATASVVNITEAYEDSRFCKDVDLSTGYRTKTILVCPIININVQSGLIDPTEGAAQVEVFEQKAGAHHQPHHDARGALAAAGGAGGGRLATDAYSSIIGAIQVINKDDDGTFTADDEILLRQLCESVSHAMSDWSTHQRALDRLSATNAGLTLMEQTLLESQSELAKRQREDARKDELMREGARLVSETSSLDDLFIRVVEDARHIVGAERCTLFLIDGEGEAGAITPTKLSEGKKGGGGGGGGGDASSQRMLWSRVAQGESGIIRIPVGQGIAGTVAESGMPLNIPDAYDDGRFDQSVDARTGFRTRSILCVPVTVQGEMGRSGKKGKVLGCVQVMNKASDAGGASVLGDGGGVAACFSKDDLMLLSQFASHVAVSVNHCRDNENKEHGLKKAAERLERLQKHMQTTLGKEVSQRERMLTVIRSLSEDRSLKMDSLLSRVGSLVTNLLGASNVAIFIVDQTTGEITLRYQAGDMRDYGGSTLGEGSDGEDDDDGSMGGMVAHSAAGAMFPPRSGLVGHVVSTHETVNIATSASTDKRFADVDRAGNGGDNRVESLLYMAIDCESAEAGGGGGRGSTGIGESKVGNHNHNHNQRSGRKGGGVAAVLAIYNKKPDPSFSSSSPPTSPDSSPLISPVGGRRGSRGAGRGGGGGSGEGREGREGGVTFASDLGYTGGGGFTVEDEAVAATLSSQLGTSLSGIFHQEASAQELKDAAVKLEALQKHLERAEKERTRLSSEVRATLDHQLTN